VVASVQGLTPELVAVACARLEGEAADGWHFGGLRRLGGRRRGKKVPIGVRLYLWRFTASGPLDKRGLRATIEQETIDEWEDLGGGEPPAVPDAYSGPCGHCLA
jgi:hypothetical protein